ncbi:bifunctional 5-dehydro-2-deoxygluconokinase/5-dehydro-2-deoxyphosphogluconate aldolase [Nitrospirillum sp. BR 11828]|uniref:bifunctional 5-dehydro-2-deoxygluconokinase/5-dehydro-2- deoxyphosphogluconate aldolase n=1 Tax=Nitrospirillum sp. BR 11828 TaxID=3104325 RepID=UPI002ACA77FF|nr:5-dehydro-2-deoxygluconokinase [Nitrospirillum sp. BR 11828]MDZ5645739.1 5-dehydro-2-deoxygluconokinase [Nitrospirillum sp. BR 11828]
MASSAQSPVQTLPKSLDLIAIGRSSVDLYGQQVGGRLEDMASFAKYLGGSPTNTAAGGARLGLRTGLVTRVGADHMGRFIREELEREGVDVTGVVSDPDRLTALVVLGIRDRDNFPLIFYRENCADMALDATDLNPDWLRGTGAVLINGTHLSQPGAFAASVAAARLVKETGGRVVFDIDYRPVLWGLAGRDRGEDRFVAHAGVTDRLREVLPLCDLVVGTEEEIHILGGVTDTVAALAAIRGLTNAVIVCKRGADGCVAFPGAIPAAVTDGLVVPGYPVEVFNVLGAGDAFMAGFLRGWLRDEPLERCCAWGNACGAIVVSRHGCAPAMPTWPELEWFLAQPSLPRRLRDSAELEHIHWATTRRHRYDELTVLAVDHRSQFEDLARELDADPARIPQFKALALKAVERVAGGDDRFGLLLDGRYGFDALASAADAPYWIGRPIEEPKSRPLVFESSADVATELTEWPLAHVVKCLVFYHPDDPEDLRERQERQLLRLFDACRKTRHEMLAEVIIPAGLPVDATTVARAIRRFYAIGVKPDWWKLEPAADPVAWRNIEAAVLENDPYCRGVVLLGLSAPEEELLASFLAAAPAGIVKGFAVGRTIFYDAARGWLANRLDDDEVVAMMAGKLKTLVDAWRQARADAMGGRAA